jgi:hypothetical protein
LNNIFPWLACNSWKWKNKSRSEIFVLMVVTQHWLVVSYWIFGTIYRSNLQVSSYSCTGWPVLIAWPLKMEPIGCSERSVTNYQSTLRNLSEERRSTPRREASNDALYKLISSLPVIFTEGLWKITKSLSISALLKGNRSRHVQIIKQGH